MLKLFKYYLGQHIFAIVFSAAFAALVTAMPGFWGISIDVHGGFTAKFFGFCATMQIEGYEKAYPQTLVGTRLFPVSDEEIVGLRYVFTGGCFFAWLIGVVAVTAFFAAKGLWLIGDPSPEGVVMCLLDTLIGAGLTYGVGLPFTYVLANKKGKLMRALMTFSTAITATFVYVIHFFQIMLVEDITNTLPLLTVAAIASLAFWALSFRKSLKLYRKINM